ncbi:MAG: hypothetical protein H5T61_09305 [Thermoflexales bacterium]|nr:hypothetical protein [Thermoflexales bacterium]
MPTGQPKMPLLNDQAWDALKQAALGISYNLADDTVYELRLRLRTPGIFALYKADVPAPGLPMLDGFLKFVAFRQAMAQVIQAKPAWTDDLLWQWNLALQEDRWWIDFPIPIREEVLAPGIAVYDCSVGLPVDPQRGEILYPAGAFFACGADLVTYPSEERGPADCIALRRRSVEPVHRPLELSGKLRSGSGGTKALDNRIYFTLTKEYAFFFRGDRDGVENLLHFALQHHIGIGKKTSLGYGQIADFEIRIPSLSSTLGYTLPGTSRIALLKNIPYQELQRRCLREQGDFVPVQRLEGGQWKDILTPAERSQNERLFGARAFSLAAPIETFDCYRPPYWRREGRTQVLRYGSLLVKR